MFGPAEIFLSDPLFEQDAQFCDVRLADREHVRPVRRFECKIRIPFQPEKQAHLRQRTLRFRTERRHFFGCVFPVPPIPIACRIEQEAQRTAARLRDLPVQLTDPHVKVVLCERVRKKDFRTIVRPPFRICFQRSRLADPFVIQRLFFRVPFRLFGNVRLHRFGFCIKVNAQTAAVLRDRGRNFRRGLRRGVRARQRQRDLVIPFRAARIRHVEIPRLRGAVGHGDRRLFRGRTDQRIEKAFLAQQNGVAVRIEADNARHLLRTVQNEPDGRIDVQPQHGNTAARQRGEQYAEHQSAQEHARKGDRRHAPPRRTEKSARMPACARSRRHGLRLVFGNGFAFGRSGYDRFRFERFGKRRRDRVQLAVKPFEKVFAVHTYSTSPNFSSFLSAAAYFQLTVPAGISKSLAISRCL